MALPIDDKRALRSRMRTMRRALPNQAGRSERIWATVEGLDAVVRAGTVMVFTSIAGEPDTAPFIAWCHERDKLVVVPEDQPDPTTVDVVVVPGVAFTPTGARLGQGGGWYDRFLAAVRPDCTSIGVGFDPQVVDELPTEAHDIRLDTIVTESGVAVPRRSNGSN
ncbi:MAG TPA: 5-formyltetrahydrofolate cyclo-ligase [Ilumatobacteraceae bacterium]|nr:5-formyltetrahydrofolate cyclo-ligase [Ilumatobacteraceae bacterium]